MTSPFRTLTGMAGAEGGTKTLRPGGPTHSIPEILGIVIDLV